MKIAVVRCGYAADSYAKTLVNYPELELVGASTGMRGNLESFSRRWSGLAETSHCRLIEVSFACVATRVDSKVGKNGNGCTSRR
jgi:hypothetical protein